MSENSNTHNNRHRKIVVSSTDNNSVNSDSTPSTKLYTEAVTNVKTSLNVAFPSPAPSTLTPLELEEIYKGNDSSQIRPTFSKPLDEVSGMLGRSSKVYAASDSSAVSLEQFSLKSAGRSINDLAMNDPPSPTEIGMATISPRQDDRQEISDTLNRTLHQCARDGDDESLVALLGHLGDRTKRIINKWDENTMNPLHYAARYNHFRIVQILVERGASVNHPGEDKQTALHYAAKYRKAKAIKKSATQNFNNAGAEDDGEQGGEPKANIQVPECADQASDGEEPGPDTPMLGDDSEYANGHSTIFLSGGGDAAQEMPSSTDERKGSSANIQSASTEDVVDLSTYTLAEDSVIAFLVKHGADPNAADKYGSTPLHFAAMRDNESALLDLLCMKHIRIEAVDKQKMTALHLAATHDNKECCRLLILKNAELRAVDDENSTPLHMAATEGNTEVVKMLFEQAAERDSWVTIQNMITDQDQEGNTALHHAVENGHYDVVVLCLEKNANVNRPRQNYVTPLHLAAISGDIRIVKKLVENHARIDALDGDQSTPLHKATAYNNEEVVEYLVKRGARIEKADKDNFTALLIAASNGHIEATKMLVKLGANVLVTDKNERTALHWAAEENEHRIIKTLLHSKGGEELLDANDRYGNTPLHLAAQHGYLECVKTLHEFKADIEDKNDEEQTPIHLAAQAGMTHIVKYLTHVDKTTINDYDENSNTPLHLAAIEGHTKVAAVLLEGGADIAARNCTLWTPIDCAAAYGRAKMIKCLLDYDSPIDPIDKVKSTPLHLACKKGHAECVRLLIAKGADVTIRNSDGFNCIDLAIDNANKDCVQAILDSDKWLDAMKQAHMDLNAEGVRVTPMRKLIRKMPDLAETVFNKCTTTNDVSPESVKFQITFNYELLDDQYTSWGGQDGSSRGGDSSLYGGSVYGDDHRVLDGVKPYSASKSEIKRNHPMLVMVKSEREDLLAHPLVTSLLRHKWHTVGRYFYYINLIIYLVFLIFLTGFALTVPSPYAVVTEGFTIAGSENVPLPSCADQLNATNGTQLGALPNFQRQFFVVFGIYVTIAIVVFKLISELFQLANAKLSYFGAENILEWTLYVTTLLFVIPFESSCTFYREPWQWQTGSVAVFLAWMELILYIRKLPRFGIYVVMFTHILSTFLQFMLVFLLFLIGFSISFYMLLANQAPFKSMEDSLLKTAIMTIGEFEFDSIFNAGSEGHVFYAAAAYLIFVIFAIIMSIIVMNLLVGLAVDDIKGVQEQAVLTRMAMQVELALTVESMMPEFITKKHIKRCLKVKPNQMNDSCSRYCCGGNAAAIISGMDSSNLVSALNPELDDIEKVMEEQERMKVQMGKLNTRTKELRSQNEKLETMVQALLNHHNIDYTEVDHEQEEEIDIGNIFK